MLLVGLYLLSMALIMSLKCQIIDVACIASWLYTKYIGNEGLGD